jgi:hypothetical protein
LTEVSYFAAPLCIALLSSLTGHHAARAEYVIARFGRVLNLLSI